LNQTNFHIINAAAGSGKTYNLVLRYLTLLLGSKTPKPYRILLALTFTNKAVNELKMEPIFPKELQKFQKAALEPGSELVPFPSLTCAPIATLDPSCDLP
jgi:ATP-dependent exoDNAse (exonuclease V) beta subunit